MFPYSLIQEDSLGPETKTDSVAFAAGKSAQVEQKKNGSKHSKGKKKVPKKEMKCRVI